MLTATRTWDFAQGFSTVGCKADLPGQSHRQWKERQKALQALTEAANLETTLQ